MENLLYANGYIIDLNEGFMMPSLVVAFYIIIKSYMS